MFTTADMIISYPCPSEKHKNGVVNIIRTTKKINGILILIFLKQNKYDCFTNLKRVKFKLLLLPIYPIADVPPIFTRWCFQIENKIRESDFRHHVLFSRIIIFVISNNVSTYYWPFDKTRILSQDTSLSISKSSTITYRNIEVFAMKRLKYRRQNTEKLNNRF